MKEKKQTSGPSSPVKPEQKVRVRSTNWHKFTIPALLLLLLAIPLTIFVSQQTQDLRQRAAEPNTSASARSLTSTQDGKVCTAGNVDTFLVIDKSESMENSINGKKKLQWAKLAADSFVDLMATEDTNYVGVASFARHGGVGLDFTKANPSAPIKKVIDDLHNESNNNGTCLECAMLDVNKKIAARKNVSPNKKFVIILSDGNINYVQKGTGNDVSGPDFGKGREQAKGAILAGVNAGTQFYLIGIGVENGDGQKWLKNVVAASGGKAKYYYGGQGDQLKQIYDEIALTMGKVSVSGTIFEDKNGNKIYDHDKDASMSGITVTLKLASNDTPVASASSDAAGKYSFSNLCADKYKVVQTKPSGFTQVVPTNPDFYPIDTTTVTTDITDKNFGNAKLDISFTFKFALHGLGIAGDNVLPRPPGCQKTGQNASDSAAQCLSNVAPVHPTREIIIDMLNNQDKAVGSMSGTISYDSENGIFTGKGKITAGVQEGAYTFRAKTPMFLKKKIIFTGTVKPGESYDLPLTDLTSSDVDNDNQLSILDYNLIVSCYTFPGQPATCPHKEGDQDNFDHVVVIQDMNQIKENGALVDVNDDGKNDEFDLNLFIRELSARQGD